MKLTEAKGAIGFQLNCLHDVWTQKDGSFGFEWVTRVILVSTPFIYPVLYIRQAAWSLGPISRRMVVELYVSAKILILMLILRTTTNCHLLNIVVFYFLIETILYLLGVILLSDIYSTPIRTSRSFLLLIVNYVEVNLEFSILYLASNGIVMLNDKISALYFSFVTFSTLGYGDHFPINANSKLLVILHIMTMLLFVNLFFTNLTPRVRQEFIDREDDY